MNDWDPARERSRARSTRPAPVTVERGCEVALADMKDAEALTAAFTGVSGVFVLIPSNFDPTPGFPEVRAIITALTTAMKAYRPTFCQGRHPLCHCKRPTRTGRVTDLFPTVWGAWLVAFTSGDFATAGRLLDELFGMANTSGDSALILQAHHAAWPTFMVTGPLAKARQHIAVGLALYRRDKHGGQALQYGGHDPSVCGHAIGALIEAAMGYPDRAVQQMQEGLELARGLDHGPTLGQALWCAAELHQIRQAWGRRSTASHERPKRTWSQDKQTTDYGSYMKQSIRPATSGWRPSYIASRANSFSKQAVAMKRKSVWTKP